jgi:hypothetical protein
MDRVGMGSAEPDDEPVKRVTAAACAEAGDLSPDLLGGYLPALIRAAAEGGTRLRGPERDACRANGGTAAREGVALAGMVDLYLSATRLLWPHLPQLLARPTARRLSVADVTELGTVCFRAADEALAAVADGFTQVRREMLRQEVSARREFLDDLLHGRTGVGELLERGERFGLHLGAGHVAAVIRPTSTSQPPSRRLGAEPAPLIALENRLSIELQRWNVLVFTRSDLIVCVAPQTQSGFGALEPWTLGQELDRLLPDVERVAGPAAPKEPGTAAGHTRDRPAVRVGVGRAHHGPLGVSRSFEEAREALTLADRLGLAAPVVLAEDMLVYRVLLRDEAAMAELVVSVLGPLAQARGGASALVETLSAYFATGGVTAQTARRLHLSIRAVTYRLARIRSLTGYSASDPAHRLRLEVAAAGAQLLGWPEKPLSRLD